MPIDDKGRRFVYGGVCNARHLGILKENSNAVVDVPYDAWKPIGKIISRKTVLLRPNQSRTIKYMLEDIPESELIEAAIKAQASVLASHVSVFGHLANERYLIVVDEGVLEILSKSHGLEKLFQP